jgi:shikimate kinase
MGWGLLVEVDSSNDISTRNPAHLTGPAELFNSRLQTQLSYISHSKFDHVVLLSAPAEILLARVTHRSTNPYGKKVEEQAEILRYISEVEPQLRATSTTEIDASAPLSHVVDQLENLA